MNFDVSNDSCAKLRILIGCDTFAPNINGAARFAERLAAELTGRGHEVHIVAPAASRAAVGTFVEEIEGAELIVHRLPSVRYSVHEWLRFVWPWRIDALVTDVLDRVKPDVIHSQSHIVIGRGLSKAAVSRGIRLIATNHIMTENIIDFIPIPSFMRALFLRWAWPDADRILARANVVTTPTERAAQLLERVTTRRGVQAISCGIRLSDYTPDLSARKTRRIVFVGRITHEKKIDVLVRALPLLETDITLELVGQGAQTQELQELARALGVADRVIWHGAVSNEKLRAALSAASVFAIASTAELQSIATLEALASGLPVVAADAMALPHLVKNGFNGYLFVPGDHEDLAKKLRAVLELDTVAFNAMQRASLEVVAQHDIDKTVAAFESLYKAPGVAGK